MSTDPQIRKYLSIDLNGYITDMTARDEVEKKVRYHHAEPRSELTHPTRCPL